MGKVKERHHEICRWC